MTKNVLAFDLGASSGRGMLARFDGEKITLEEVHRFPHNFSMLNGHAYWNLLHLMDEMKNGLRKSGKDLSGVGFDTWGVDCGFLSREGDLLAMPGSYRDPGLDDEGGTDRTASKWTDRRVNDRCTGSGCFGWRKICIWTDRNCQFGI